MEKKVLFLCLCFISHPFPLPQLFLPFSSSFTYWYPSSPPPTDILGLLIAFLNWKTVFFKSSDIHWSSHSLNSSSPFSSSRISSLFYMKIEVAGSSPTSVTIYETAWGHVPEDYNPMQLSQTERSAFV